MTDNRLVCRHPKIVLIYQHEDDISCLLPIILDVNREFRVIANSKKLQSDIKQLNPCVVLFALDSVLQSTKVYLNLVEQKVLSTNHYSILLCNNKESGLSFQSCIKKLFNNYFVFQPLYEKLRLKLVIHEGLIKCQTAYSFDEKQAEQLNKQNEEFTRLLEQGAQCRKDLVNTLQESKNNLPVKSIDPIDTEQVAKNKLLDEINKDHLIPLFQLLESNISDSINSLLEMMTKQHLNTANTKNTHLINHSRAENTKEVVELLAKMKQQEVLPPPDKTILIVEDNHIYREMISSVLQKEGFIIDEAEDGLKAIKKIKENEYTLIIMDLFMPNLDGLNTTRHIRKLQNGSKTPIIALSGNKRKELVQKWASHGLSGYIMKPSTKSEILQTVDKALT